MKQNSSSRRVNEQARQVIAETLMFEFSDPRLNMITITGCEVSFDRSACNVYYTTTRESYGETSEALSKAAGRLRSLLAKKLSWRTSPELRFFLDSSVDEAEKIARALESERRRMPADSMADAEDGEEDAEDAKDAGDAEDAGDVETAKTDAEAAEGREDMRDVPAAEGAEGAVADA